MTTEMLAELSVRRETSEPESYWVRLGRNLVGGKRGNEKLDLWQEIGKEENR